MFVGNEYKKYYKEVGMMEKIIKTGENETKEEIDEIQDYLLKLIVKVKNTRALKFVTKYLEAVEYQKTDY